jgi:hypothetical protein
MLAPEPSALRSIEGMNAVASAYVDGLNAHGIPALVRNLVTRIETRQVGERLLAMTVNRSEPTDTYVCSPHTAFVRYLSEEISTLPVRAAHAPLRLLVSGFDKLLRAARVDDIVHLNNWLLSTNLTGGLAIPDVPRPTRSLAEEFPDAILAIRSLNEWANGELIRSLVAGGWQLIPSRQVWVIDDFSRDWSGRRDTKRDCALAGTTPLRREELQEMNDADAARISELYGLLYLQKYSRLNPDYSPGFIKLTHRIGMIRYIAFRDADGTIQSVAGCFRLGDEVTTPIVGYDTARPAEEGLYRLATWAIFDYARREGLRLNLSSGAAGFKKNRGARPQIEYSAIHVGHLSRPRRLAIGALRQALNGLAVPMMRRYQL